MRSAEKTEAPPLRVIAHPQMGRGVKERLPSLLVFVLAASVCVFLVSAGFSTNLPMAKRAFHPPIYICQSHEHKGGRTPCQLLRAQPWMLWSSRQVNRDSILQGVPVPGETCPPPGNEQADSGLPSKNASTVNIGEAMGFWQGRRANPGRSGASGCGCLACEEEEQSSFGHHGAVLRGMEMEDGGEAARMAPVGWSCDGPMVQDPI